jgi:enoyl-CoA hydratase/carnithine racemase
VPRPESDNLSFSVDEGIASIVLDRGDGRNAMSTQLYADLRDAFRQADADSTVHCVIVSSAAASFAVGGDLKEMASYLGEGDPDWKLWRFRDNLPFETIRSCRKPSIAVVDGLCVGGGFATAVSCDFVIASPSSKFGTPETKVALIDGLIPAALYGQMPLPTLKYILFSGNFVTAEQAEQLGIIFRCVAPDQLMPLALSMAKDFERNGQQIIANYKQMFRSYERPVLYDDTIATLYRDKPTQQRVQAFFQRKPVAPPSE